MFAWDLGGELFSFVHQGHDIGYNLYWPTSLGPAQKHHLTAIR
jgi:hypothetical protein